MIDSEEKIVLELEVNNTTHSLVEEDFFLCIAKKTIQKTNYDFLQGKKMSLSLALVAEKEMQELNKQYRQKDSVTDILSFFEYETIDEIKNAVENPPAGGMFLGELIVCYSDIVSYAEKQNIVIKKELANVVSHGVLHLLGFSHGEEMFAIQKEIINEIC